MSLPESDPLPINRKGDHRSFFEQLRNLTPDRPPASNRNMNDPMRPTPHHLKSRDEFEAEVIRILDEIRAFAESEKRIDSGRPVGALDVLTTALAAMQQAKLVRFDYDHLMSLKREMDLMAIITRELAKEAEPGEHSDLKTMSQVFAHYIGKYRALKQLADENRNRSWWKRVATAALGGI